MRLLTRRQYIQILAASSLAASCADPASKGGSPVDGASRRRMLPESAITTIRAEEDWYMHSAGVVATGGETLCCTYRRSDEHIASEVEVWRVLSRDGGKTWQDHEMLTRSAWDPDKANWVAPQLGETRDGRLLLLIDRGVKTSKFDWTTLSEWQKPPRGMSNWLMESADGGITWTEPRKIDDVGGEPSYIIELSNGDWLYTRTDSAPTTAKKFPSMPWGPNYYKSTAVISTNQGTTWDIKVPVADDPLIGDCEVGVAEWKPGSLIAISRIGDAGSALGQPSRFIFSADFGRTWSKPVLSPIYAHRPCVKPLQNGKLMVSFRNAWGTPGSCVFVFHPEEKFTYQPNSFLWDPSRCRMEDGCMVLDTGMGSQEIASFTLYPMEDDESALELEFELAVERAEENACNVAAGAWIRFLPTRVEVAARTSEGFDIDATKFHNYRVVHEGGRLVVFADGEKRIDTPDKGIFDRLVRFGCRHGAASIAGKTNPEEKTRQPLKGPRYQQTNGLSKWKSFRASVRNRRDHSVEWKWTPADGFPDQFQRNRVVCLEPNGAMSAGDSGYSGWDQMPEGSIVVVDYSTTKEGLRHPILRAYRIERDLVPEAFA